MNRIRLLAVVALLLLPALVWAADPPVAKPDQADSKQEPDKDSTPSKLDDMIRLALDANPQIVQAKLQVRVAEAELRRQMFDVTGVVTTLYYTRQSLADEQTLLNEQANLVSVELRKEASLQNRQKLATLRNDMLELKRKRAQIEVQIRATLGTPLNSPYDGLSVILPAGTASPDGRSLTFFVGPQEPAANKPVAESPPATPAESEPQIPPAIAKALEAKVSIDGNDLALDELVSLLQMATGGDVLFVVDREAREEQVSVTLHLPREVTVREAMEIIGDVAELTFIVRDYGILVTERTDAVRVPGFTIIPDYSKAAGRK